MMKNEVHIERESPFACVMDAIEPNKRHEHIATAKFVFAAVTDVRELPNGYAFHLPNNSEMLRKVGDFISLERLCCPFFGFTLEVEREGGKRKGTRTNPAEVERLLRARALILANIDGVLVESLNVNLLRLDLLPKVP
jgi:hypothetical protein